MSNRKQDTFRRVIFLCGITACGWLAVLTSGQAQGQINTQEPGSPVITGKLLDYYGPIVKAQVYLNAIKDEGCARLFEKNFEVWKKSKNELKKLQACVKDVGPVEPNAAGTYTFSNLSPGYYALVVSWNTNEKFKKPVLAFKKGDIVVTYYEGAPYNAVATGKPFYFSGTESVTKDFDFTKGVITNETPLN
jgi:hypothetical protein